MPRLILLLASTVALSCTADSTWLFDLPPTVEAGVDAPTPSADKGQAADLPLAPDLPSSAGEPCYGTCVDGLICLAGRCHAECTAADDPCNDQIPPCADGERCLKVSDFAHACIAATPAGGECGGGEVFCAGGTLCVDLGNGQQRCLQLCKYGCAADKCFETITKCEVCAE